MSFTAWPFQIGSRGSAEPEATSRCPRLLQSACTAPKTTGRRQSTSGLNTNQTVPNGACLSIDPFASRKSSVTWRRRLRYESREALNRASQILEERAGVPLGETRSVDKTTQNPSRGGRRKRSERNWLWSPRDTNTQGTATVALGREIVSIAGAGEPWIVEPRATPKHTKIATSRRLWVDRRMRPMVIGMCVVNIRGAIKYVTVQSKQAEPVGGEQVHRCRDDVTIVHVDAELAVMAKPTFQRPIGDIADLGRHLRIITVRPQRGRPCHAGVFPFGFGGESIRLLIPPTQLCTKFLDVASTDVHYGMNVRRGEARILPRRLRVLNAPPDVFESVATLAVTLSLRPVSLSSVTNIRN